MTLSRVHIAIAIAIMAGLLITAFILWLQWHDEQLKNDLVQQSNAPAIKQAQDQVKALTHQIADVNSKSDQRQALIDAKFDKLTTLTQQVANMAATMGMKQQPVIIQPGQVAQLPQGGVGLTPQQVQENTDYQRACETCKNDNLRLTDTLSRTQAIVAAKETENAKLRQDLDSALKAAKKGFRYKLVECGKRTVVTTVAGGTVAAVIRGVPGDKKDIGRGFEVGAAVGALSCIFLKP